MPKKPMPKFPNEAEEGRWFREHQDELDDYMTPSTAEDQGRLDRLAAALPPRKQSKTISISVPEQMLDRARRQAERKGIGYQTYLKTLIAEGLEREERASG